MKLQGLYGITDTDLLANGRLLPYVEAALKGGMRVLQYRDKTTDSARRYDEAQALKNLCAHYGAQLIINDDILLAKELAVGLHLGQEDGSLIKARELLGRNAIIGATCHGSIELAEQAKAEGASYLAFGRFFPSKTKPNAKPADMTILSKAKALGLPICAIGGITLNNIHLLTQHGVNLIAVVNELFDTVEASQVEIKAKQLINAIHF